MYPVLHFQGNGILNEKGPLDLTCPQHMGNGHLPVEPEPKQKKLMKSPVVKSMLGSKWLFRASLRLRKKKKQKQSKRHILDIWKLAQKDIMGDSSNDPGTSTSEKHRVVDCMLVRRKKRPRHDTLKKGSARKASKSSGDCPVNSLETKEKGAEERIGPHIAVLATDQQLEKSVITAETQCDVQDKRVSVHRGMMSMLTRGLEMPTGRFPLQLVSIALFCLDLFYCIFNHDLNHLSASAVARWDDIESSSSGAFGLGGAHNGSIGYVLDEW